MPGFFQLLQAADEPSVIVEDIQHNTRKAIDKAQEELITYHQLYEQSPNKIFDKESTYPILIYKKDSLVFWSDFEVAIDNGKLLKSESPSYIQLGPESYLVVKQEYNEDYHFIALVPIMSAPSVQNVYLNPGLNKTIFKDYKVLINPDSVAQKVYVKAKSGEELFHIRILEEDKYESNNYLLFVFYVLIMLLGYFLIAKRFPWIAVLFVVIYRTASLLLEYPSAYFSDWLFDPKVYAASALSPTLGDFLLNSICVVIIIFHLSKFLHSRFFVSKIHLFAGTFALSFLLLLLLTEGFFVLLLNLYKNSQYNYDFFSLTTFPSLEVAYGVVFLLLSYIYITSIHAIIQLMKHTFFDRVKVNVLTLVLGIVGVGMFFPEHWYLYVAVIGLVFLGLRTNLPKSIVHFTSTTYVYTVLLIISASWVAFTALREDSLKEEYIKKSKFADQLLNKHDPLAEYLLSEALKDVEGDAFIKSIILDPSKSKSVIYQKIQNIFMNKYFDKYNVDIHLFNSRGVSFDGKSSNNYLDWEKDFGLIEYATEYDNVYFHHDLGGATSGRLVGFSNVVKNNKVIGSLVIDLKMKRIIPSSVYPKLLLDEKMVKGANTEGYFYAFYKDSLLAYSYGNFNYPAQLAVIEQHSSGFNHYIQEGEEGELVVVSSKDSRFLSGNFSYHFLLITFSALLWSLLLSVKDFKKRRNHMSFAVKIRLFLGSAFFVPLLIITISLVGIINTNYKQEKEEEIIKTSEGLNDRLATLLDSYTKGKISLNELANNVNMLSIHSGLDQNIYSKNGKLLYSSQPEIFETGLISRLMNPKAYQDIVLQSKKYALLNEQIQKLQYNAIYWAIHSNISGELIGVLHLPFYNAKEELANRELAVFSTVINVFSLILIITVLIYPLTINSLTSPLKLIASKLKKTSFSGENEKIDWNSPDELGMLVQQYNEMIAKLEESKQELAKQEKEHAWREMAKQVAHEIKNPLTPMKLTLQHLQRTGDVEAVKKAINMLLTQVEILNDIATSFSSFAKMPEPESEQFNLSDVVKKGVLLYQNENAEVSLLTLEEGVHVYGDEKLMGRILTNLILNGIQSVENGKEPVVNVKLERKDADVLLSVEDNGEGIPEDVRDKVFVPNFSTKYSGSGIGLAVAKRGVEHAGGKIWFETQQNKGTTFYIQLPVIQG